MKRSWTTHQEIEVGGRSQLQVEKDPEVNLARQVKARLWRVQNMWNSDLTWR